MTDHSTEILLWHDKFGGSCVHPRHLFAHALRLLNETVELCIACGAEPSEIVKVVFNEIAKAGEKKEIILDRNALTNNSWNNVQVPKIEKEAADVVILLDILESYGGFNIHNAVREKLYILYERKWEADEHGVLWHEGKVPK